MKTFLVKSILFFLIVLSILSFALIKYGGYIDHFYNKFTTPKASSLIIGDSRSLQDIQPSILNKALNNTNLELPILNYSFTVKEIAYGKPYTESILRKLDQSTKNGIFILSVHPFVLSNRTGNHEEENGIYFEEDMPPHNMRYVNINPNFEYLFENWNYFHFRGIFRKSSKTHKDGWLEEKNLPSDTLVLNKWAKNQIRMYGDYTKKWQKSKHRLLCLENLVEKLNSFGKVFLVRLPVGENILNIENKYWEGFNEDMVNISKKHNGTYLNFKTENKIFKTFDGVHLDKFTGVPFTKALADSINKHVQNNK